METANLAIHEGIKAVAIGQKGSKPLTQDLAQKILLELASGKVPEVVKGAFIGALIFKGPTPDEMMLEQAFPPGSFAAPEALVEHLAPNAPTKIKNIAVSLLNKEELEKETAKILGSFLFSRSEGDALRGLAASVLRVRYETAEEYAGLLECMTDTIEEPFKAPVPSGDPVLQIAEPFDGADHSHLITPLLAKYLQVLGFRVVTLCGRNSGPKYGTNVYDLAKATDATFVKTPDDLGKNKPVTGWYLDQADLSKTLNQWVAIRRQIIKRPFLATLERFVNPFDAQILIASAFHPPYGEKMIRVAEDAGYPSAIIVRNGLEGSIAFALKRAAKILCTARQADGTYKRHELEFDPEKFLGRTIEIEEKLKTPSVAENERLIREYLKEGKTSNLLFNDRVEATCSGIKKALEWIEANMNTT